MMVGTITRLVVSYGSLWGRIRPEGQEREVFFNPGTLVEPAGYSDLLVGQEVEFEEEKDRANGTHAVNVRARAVD